MHWSHRRIGVGFLSLGVRLVVPALTALAATNAESGGALVGIVIGGSVLTVAAMSLDIALLAREQIPSEARSGARWFPTLAVSPGGAMAGLAGTF